MMGQVPVTRALTLSQSLIQCHQVSLKTKKKKRKKEKLTTLKANHIIAPKLRLPEL